MDFLYTKLIEWFGKRHLENTTVPNYITDNLRFEIRPYQKDSFQRFILFDSEGFEGKPNKPDHLLYNMATGSGKTLVMAGLMLYLYEKGYRNFLFFVNSNNVIAKTKENFLNGQSSKYLFKEKIIIDNREVFIKEVDNFDDADEQNININFVSIQKLETGLLRNVRENGVSFEDFENRKVVLLADEAHHNNAVVWGEVVDKILNQNLENILLEFTATLDYESQKIVEKYKDKVIQKYSLADFRIDKYSKEIHLVRSLYDEEERIIQALLLNLYRQELATSKGINLKPVILFKAKRTVAESEQNKIKFHKLIDNFSAKEVEKIKETSTVDIIQKAFTFFESQSISFEEISKRIQSNFKEENCISANNDKEAELNQIRLNTLEEPNNPIRAVFAVQKLNEGWDVLNLFDIVRLYEGQNTGGSNTKIGKTTLSEAQLIGRGARYFPFKLEEGQDAYKRKYDHDPANDLKILEELYYHTKEDNRYISELKKALVESGIYEDEDNLETKKLILKEGFKQTNFYKTGKVIFNKKIEKSYNNVKSFEDLGVKKKNIEFILSSGAGLISKVFMEEEAQETELKQVEKNKPNDIPLSKIDNHIIRYALTQNPFYYFDNLKRYFPNLKSISDFVESKNYLSGLEITFLGSTLRLSTISNKDYLLAIQLVLQTIEAEIKANLTQYEGSPYINRYISQIFKDKEIRVTKGSEKAKGQEELVKDKDWYVFNANYGTSEEKAFVKLFDRRFENVENSFENIYLIRNEREIKIIDKLGRAFEPDFLLFCKQKEGEELTYQVFIEPKGKHLSLPDKWKEDFLKEIREEKKIIKIDSDKYLITGIPFYNQENENEFKEFFETTLFEE